MNTHVPTLSTDGFITDLKLKLRRLYSYFLIAEHSQTNLYKKQPVSINHLLEMYSDDITTLRIQIEDTLSIFFKKYFENVSLEITIRNDNEDKKDIIYIAVEVKENNNMATLLESIDITEDNYIKNGYLT